MKRKRNGVEIKNVRPNDVIPFIPHAKLHPQINYSEVDGKELEKRGKWRRAALMAQGLRIILGVAVKVAL